MCKNYRPTQFSAIYHSMVEQYSNECCFSEQCIRMHFTRLLTPHLSLRQVTDRNGNFMGRRYSVASELQQTGQKLLGYTVHVQIHDKNSILECMAQIPLSSTRLDSTHSTCRAHAFGCVELVEEHSSTCSTRRARLARHVELDWLDTSSSTGSTRRARQALLAT